MEKSVFLSTCGSAAVVKEVSRSMPRLFSLNCAHQFLKLIAVDVLSDCVSLRKKNQIMKEHSSRIPEPASEILFGVKVKAHLVCAGGSSRRGSLTARCMLGA